MAMTDVDRVRQWFLGLERAAVALSGGMDSLTLCVLAHQALGRQAQMFHAVSAAVPAAAGKRVRALAAELGWNLSEIDAGELCDERYLSNPLERCYFCKSRLYQAIAQQTTAQIVSGTNYDDLSDFRPGLVAAREYLVRHPFAELEIGKAQIRQIARDLAMPEIAALAASPCLSSRVETGVLIEGGVLQAIDQIEDLLRRLTGAQTVRCRVRGSGVEIQLDPQALAGISVERRGELAGRVKQLLPVRLRECDFVWSEYRMGSAFIGK